MQVAMTHGIYLPIVAFAVVCLAVFIKRLGWPLVTSRRAELQDNYLAISVIGFVFVLGYETPLYWLVRNVEEVAWISQEPLLFFPPKVVACVSMVFAAAGLNRALTGRAHLLLLVLVAGALWVAGAVISMIARSL